MILSIIVCVGLGVLAGASSELGPDEQDTSCLPDLPPLVIQKIAGFASVEVSAVLSQLNNFTNNLCEGSLNESAIRHKHFTGYDGKFMNEFKPSFMSAMKGCMIKDSVPCYDIVLKIFEEENKEAPWRLAQLPALASQLGAYRIFKKLDVYKNYQEHKKTSASTRDHSNPVPLWYKWMTRAAVSKRFRFVKQVSGHILITGSEDGLPILNYKSSKISGYLYRLQHEPFKPDHGGYIRSRRGVANYIHSWNHQQSWIDFGLFDQGRDIPGISRIFDVMATNNKQDINQLKEEIIGVLSQGIYLLDDMLENPVSTAILWWYYGHKVDAHDDGSQTLSPAAEFVRWLTREGAPIDERDLLENYWSFSRMKVSRSENLLRYHQALNAAIYYSPGGGNPTSSLAHSFKFYYRTPKVYVGTLQDVLYVYKHVLHANFFEPSVLKEFVRFLSVGTRDWTRRDQVQQVLQFYLENGLTGEHLRRFERWVQYTTISPERDIMLERILPLKLAVLAYKSTSN